MQEPAIEVQNKSYKQLEEFQTQILDEVSKIPNFPFIFTGGTALTKVYFDNHRRSYDLDYFGNFSQCSDIDTKVRKAFNNAGVTKISYNPTIDQEGMRMDKYIIFKNIDGVDITMKVDFVQDYYYGLFPHVNHSGWKVDSLDAIYFRKIYTLYSKDTDRIKDLIDLYFLNTYKDFDTYYRNTYLTKLKEYLKTVNRYDESRCYSTPLLKAVNQFCKHLTRHCYDVDIRLGIYGSKLSHNDLHNLFYDFYGIINKKINE